MKTLKDLKELVEGKERELAPGLAYPRSETPILEALVSDFGYPSSWTEEEKNRDVTDTYRAYERAYGRLRGFPYDSWERLWE